MMKEVTIEELAENVDNPRFGDDRLGVMFYMRTEEDKERTLAEGRKCFRDREFVRIMIPGDRNPAADRRVQVTGNELTDDRHALSQAVRTIQGGRSSSPCMTARRSRSGLASAAHWSRN